MQARLPNNVFHCGQCNQRPRWSNGRFKPSQGACICLRCVSKTVIG